MKTIPALVFLTLLPFSMVSADGAGGLYYGFQYYHDEWSSQDLESRYLGGFGYGVNSRGSRMGGFGFALLSDDPGNPGTVTGGFGGTITGREVNLGPLMLGLNVWAGVGGVKSRLDESGLNEAGSDKPRGYLALYGELNAEVGFALTPWFQLVVYGGIQGMGNLLPGSPFEDLLVYTPMIGGRLAWGSFR